MVFPETPLTVRAGSEVPFEAVAYTSDGAGVISNPKWLWQFGDGGKSSKNPTSHAYTDNGVYTVMVTATSRQDVGTASVVITVFGADGGVGAESGATTLWVRDSQTKTPVDANGICDDLEVVLDVSNVFMMSTPTLYRQPEVDFGTQNWQDVGIMVPDMTVPPGVARFTALWLSCGEKNRPVRFKAEFYEFVFVPPFMFPSPILIVVGPEEWTPNNTLASAGDDVIVFAGTSVDIEWEITHADRRAPSFNATIEILEIGGSSAIKTFTQTQSIGPGSVTWSGETDAPQPAADPGIYKYRVTGVHLQSIQPCQDKDKSRALTISGVTVSDFEWTPETSFPPAFRVSLDYDLSVDAECVTLEVYDSALGLLPVSNPSGGALSLTQGHHEATVELGVCPPHMGEYAFVIHAMETTETAEGVNRDLEPKPALQNGDVLAIWPPAYGAAGLDTGSPPNHAAFLERVERAHDAWSEMASSGSHYEGTHGQGLTEPEEVWQDRMDEGPVAVLYTASHANWFCLSFDDVDASKDYNIYAPLIHPIDGQPTHDPTIQAYSIGQLDGGDLEECLFVFLHGCHTAEPNPNTGYREFVEALRTRGTLHFAGFEASPDTEHGPLFAETFWDTAVMPGQSIQSAYNAALDRIERLGQGSMGFDSFWTTVWGLQLYPARFAGDATCSTSP